MRIIAFISARNEAETLPKVLESMINQTVPFTDIIVVNDASDDETGEIAESYGCTVINLSEKHPSYAGRPELAKIFNRVFDYLDSEGIEYDYLMQHGADTILPEHYVEQMLQRMESRKDLVIASGTIKGEPVSKTHARGAGRFIKGWFWRRYVKRYPITYIWESYPIYKALSLGYKVTNFPDLVMETLRPTKCYKPFYGAAMKELGYLPIYALARCFLAFMEDKRVGVDMLKTYLFSSYCCYDPEIKRAIRRYQANQIVRLLRRPKEILLRMRGWESR